MKNKIILTLEATIHNSVAMPWEIGEEYEDGTYSEIKRGVINAFNDGEALAQLQMEADEIYEVDSLAARTNRRRVK